MEELIRKEIDSIVKRETEISEEITDSDTINILAALEISLRMETDLPKNHVIWDLIIELKERYSESDNST